MRRFFLSAALAAIPIITTAAAEPTVVSCKFEKLPPMLLTFRGGMGADDNTLQVGKRSLFPSALVPV